MRGVFCINFRGLYLALEGTLRDAVFAASISELKRTKQRSKNRGSIIRVIGPLIFLSFHSFSGHQMHPHCQDYLSMHSSYFRSLFHGGYEESSKDVIELGGVKLNAFVNLLRVS